MKIYCEACKSVFEAERPENGTQVACPKCGAMVNFPESPTSPGAVIGDFLIEREISKGGMGEVFLARQLSLDRPVALKVLQDRFLNDKEYVESLFREARAAGKINHPNIVQAYAVGEENGIFYFAMEYVRGETFKQILQRQKKLDFMQAAKVVREIASALDAAWREQKLVHQDIKPDNIMLDANGFAKLADLGLARVAGNENRDEEIGDEVMGTPQYISPEQLTGVPTDVRSDIYSLGATLYQFVTGRFPYVADTAEEIARMHVAGNLTPPKEVNPEVPDELNTIIMKMMARNIEDRYQTPAPLIKALDMFMRNYRPAGPGVPTLNLKFGKKAAAPTFKLPAAAKAAVPKMTAHVSPAQPAAVSNVAPKNDGNVTGASAPSPAPVPAPAPASAPAPAAEEKPKAEEKPAAPAPAAEEKPKTEEKPAAMTAENIPRPEMAPEPEAPQEEPPPRRHLSRRMKLILLIAGIVLVVVLGAGGTFVFLAKGDKLPEPLKPYGKPVAEWFAAREKAAAEEPAPEPEKKAEPVPPPKPPEPPKPTTRQAYLDGVEKFLTLVRNRPDDREGQLAAGDEFFTRFPQPQTEEERTALRTMQEVYGRLDEVLRAAPARAAARERHLKEIAERREASDEAKRERAEAEAAARRQREEQARILREQAEEQKRQAAELQRQLAARAAELKTELRKYYLPLVAGFYKAGLDGEDAELKAAVRSMSEFIAPSAADSKEEKALLGTFRAMRQELPKEAEKFRNFVRTLEGVNETNSFNVELASHELADVISIRPGKVVCRRAGAEPEPLPLDDARVRRQFFSRLEQKLKLKNPEFWFRLMNRQLDGETAKLAPAGFWRNNFRTFAEAVK